MANRVQGTDEAILYCAKAEFLEKGFNEASLRVISQNAGVSTSTIYTRYSDKEGLFKFLVDPIIKGLIDYVYNSLYGFCSLEKNIQIEQKQNYSDNGFKNVVDYIYDNFDEFKLIVNCSPNSFYNDFLESLVNIDMKWMKSFLENIQCVYYLEGNISDGFLHVVTSAFYSGIFEVVKHDMPKDEALSYINELRKFYNSGWKEYF